MDDIADLLRDPIAVGAETKAGRGQIATDDRDPPPMPLGSVEYRAEQGVQPGVRLRAGGSAH
jgi:hypothetical protein